MLRLVDAKTQQLPKLKQSAKHLIATEFKTIVSQKLKAKKAEEERMRIEAAVEASRTASESEAAPSLLSRLIG